MTMTKETIAELRRLLAAAPAAPWGSNVHGTIWSEASRTKDGVLYLGALANEPESALAVSLVNHAAELLDAAERGEAEHADDETRVTEESLLKLGATIDPETVTARFEFECHGYRTELVIDWKTGFTCLNQMPLGETDWDEGECVQIPCFENTGGLSNLLHVLSIKVPA